MSNSTIALTTAEKKTPLALSLKEDCKSKKKSDDAGVKAHRLLAEAGYRSTDLMSPLTKGSTCDQEAWEYFEAAYKESLTDSALKLYNYDNTNGLSDRQKVERRRVQRRFTHMTGNWKKGLVRLEKAIAKEEGHVVAAKASFETKLHDKLSTIVKQLEGRDVFNGNLLALSNSLRDSLTHIKLK